MENEKLQEQTESMQTTSTFQMMPIHGMWSHVIRKNEPIFIVKVEGIVNGGVHRHDRRTSRIHPGIPPFSFLYRRSGDLSSKEIDVSVIEANQAEGRLVLSAREILREQKKSRRCKKTCICTGWKCCKRYRWIASVLRCFCTSRERSFRSGSHFPDQYPENQISRPGTSRWGRSRCQSHRYQRR